MAKLNKLAIVYKSSSSLVQCKHSKLFLCLSIYLYVKLEPRIWAEPLVWICVNYAYMRAETAYKLFLSKLSFYFS